MKNNYKFDFVNFHFKRKKGTIPMKNKKYIIAIVIILLVIVIFTISSIIIKNKNTKTENEINQENVVEYEPQEGIDIDENQVSYQKDATIDELKKDVGATGNDNIYEITTEYDGRQILTIKPNVQFCVVLSGILENKQPENNLEKLEEKTSNFLGKHGIWIAENSRETFQALLKETTKNTYSINEDGYLVCETNTDANETDKKITDILSSDKLYIISMTGTCYILDEISGEVVEYPFEKMDPYQAYESYENDNQKIYVLTTNQAKKLSNQELIDAIIWN